MRNRENKVLPEAAAKSRCQQYEERKARSNHETTATFSLSTYSSFEQSEHWVNYPVLHTSTITTSKPQRKSILADLIVAGVLYRVNLADWKSVLSL